MQVPAAQPAQSFDQRPISGKTAVGIILALIVGVLILGAAFGGHQGDSNGNAESPTSAQVPIAPPEPPPVLVTADELEQAYRINTVAADDRFKGRRLLVSGLVQDINTDISDDVYIAFASRSDSFSRPQAHLASSERSTAAKLVPGQAIQLLCVGAGDIVKSPMLRNCVFSNGAPSVNAAPTAVVAGTPNGEAQATTADEEQPPQRLEHDKPATLEGELRTDVFDNCCVDGNATKQPYLYIHLYHSITLRDLGPDARAPNENLDANIQLGGLKPEAVDQALIGHKVTVKCSSLYEGGTGHYATEAYCADASVL
jgi:hypothetical protein